MARHFGATQDTAIPAEVHYNDRHCRMLVAGIHK
jgi:hypothetical protein